LFGWCFITCILVGIFEAGMFGWCFITCIVVGIFEAGMFGWCFITCIVVRIFEAGMFAISSDRNYRKNLFSQQDNYCYHLQKCI